MEITTVTTGTVRISFEHLMAPHAMEQGQEPKYSCTCLLPKTDTDTMSRISAAIAAATEKGKTGKWNNSVPPVLATPVYDGDGVRPTDGMPFGDECKGKYVFTCSCNLAHKPEVVDINGNPILNASEVYSGMYGRVNFSAFPYLHTGKKGIGFSLNCAQKLQDGEPLAGKPTSASEAFGTPAPQAAVSGGIDPITGLPC